MQLAKKNYGRDEPMAFKASEAFIMKKKVLTIFLFLMSMANGATEVFSLPARANPEDGAIFHSVGPYSLGGKFADQRQKLPNAKKDGCYEVSFDGRCVQFNRSSVMES